MESVAPPPPLQQQPKTSGLAIASVICGPLGILTAGLSGIAAVITGHMALSAIKRSGGMLTGTGMSITGLITGYLSILILPIAVIAGLTAPVILKQRKMADRTQVLSNSKQLGVALLEFDSEYGSYPSDALAGEHPDFAGLTGPDVLKQLAASGQPTDLNRLLVAPGSKDPLAQWTYFPGSSSDAPTKPLLISPEVGEKCIVLLYDHSAMAVDPAVANGYDRKGSVTIPATKKPR